MASTHYVEGPSTPNSGPRTDNDGAKRSKKLRLAERYAQEKPFRRRENPLQHASLLAVISAHWLQPLVSLGARKVLEKEDVWAVAPQDSCEALQERFGRHHTPQKRELFNLPHVAMGFLETFRRQIGTVIVNYCVYMTAMVLQPFIAKAILQFLDDEPNVFRVDNGYVLVALMVVVSFVGVTCLNYGFFLSSRVGANMRTIAMDIVYRKALRLSCVARQAYTTGEITTLMSVDSERIFFAVINGPWILVAPLAFLVTVVLIGVLFDGVSAVCGAALLVVVLYTSMQLAEHIGLAQEDLLSVAEERVKVTSEAMQGIRVMKFYAWEESLASRVETIRAAEIKHYRKFHYLQITNTILLFLAPVFLGGLVMGIYVGMNGTITVTDAYTIINVVNITRLAVNMFPLAVASLSQASVTYRRMDAYLACDEVKKSKAGELQSVGDSLNQLEQDVIDEHEDNEQADKTEPASAIPVKKDESSAHDRSRHHGNGLISSEDRVKGRVSGQTYRSYFDETGFNGVLVVLTIVAAYFAGQGMRIVVDWWQGHWAKEMGSTSSSYSELSFALWYFGFIVVCALVTIGRGLLMMESCIRSSKNLHNELFRRVLSAPVNLYFDVTPVGRIPNRFSNDLDQMDSVLPQHYQSLFQSLGVLVGCLVVCALASFWVGVSYLPMLAIFVVTGVYFKQTSREVKRLEGITRSPVFNLFGETLNGLHTIRAFKMQDTFVQLNKAAVDDNTSFYFTYWAAGRWLAIRLDWLSVVVIFVVTIYLVTSKVGCARG
ncbi:hypothetical protein KRP22_012747 [Phytophthora ramorum]|nr:ABC transporter C family member 3 [Phytophthora ramorum]